MSALYSDNTANIWALLKEFIGRMSEFTMHTGQVLQVKKVDPEAKLPICSTQSAAGYDLYALNEGVVPPRDKSIIRTGICIRMPTLPFPFRIYGRICSRSGLSAKFNLETGAGVIDIDYKDELMVILHNHSDEPYRYCKHDRIAQLVLEVHTSPKIEEVEEFDALDSDRVGGFGSTGL